MSEEHHSIRVDGMRVEQPQKLQHSEDPKADWLSNSKTTLLVVITLITTLSFQLGVNPPGGFWQEDKDGHIAGNVIMKDKHPKKYMAFLTFSLLCFYSSVGLILFLLTGISVKSHWFRGTFVFCIANLAFLFLASQTNNHLSFAFGVGACVLILGAVIVYRSKHSHN